ncbi:hypothetical protein M9H77_18005 [Catharanthus roseus]|uniref:Uncharacterized protein n=1 Tax=Catharanthus roseus TaxID=4058 RepID=A0ACC0B6F0_CATRO|nr:hypothetical protein M9H77_18005 [Catharanthus roseus]
MGNCLMRCYMGKCHLIHTLKHTRKSTQKQPKPSFSGLTIHGPPGSRNEAHPSSTLAAQQHYLAASNLSHDAVQQDHDPTTGNNAGQHAPAPNAAPQHPISLAAAAFDPTPTKSCGPVSPAQPTVIILVQFFLVQLLLAQKPFLI